MLAISILSEDNDVVVINKPAGLAVHGDGVNTDMTLVDWFLATYPESRGVGETQPGRDGEPLERSGVVHRLDRDTSGVMVLARTPAAYQHLKQQFHDRLVKKEYRALVYGALYERYGTIDRPIGRSAKEWRLRSAEPGAKGTLRDARTDWENLGTGEYKEETFSYMKLLPHTGRMHQLRVHLKAIGRPIVGDPLYAGNKLTTSNNLELSRLALHAYTLLLTLPDGSEQRFIAPIPDDFTMAIDRLHNEMAD